MAKYRKRLSFGVRLCIVFALALLAVLALSLVLHTAGFRFITCHRLDGTDVKFIGRVDKTGQPSSGRIMFPNGTVAVVDMVDGTIKYASGAEYKGGLSKVFEREGNGIVTFSNGDSYEGAFTADVINGYGVYRYANGDIYEGNFNMGVKEGHGKFYYADGEIYEGEFADDLRNGAGQMTKPDGTSFSGTYASGVKTGKGTYVYSNGDVYEGDFSMDMRHGTGKYVWANGESYEGSFVNNNITGYGTYTWVTGRASYTGYFKDGAIVLIDPTDTGKEAS